MTPRPPAPPRSAGGRALLTGILAFGGRAGWEYFLIAFAGRLPFAMMIVGLLTIVSTTTGSIAEGGLVAASAGVGTAVCGPVVGSLADRVGQRTVLLVCAGVSVLADAALLIAVSAAPPVWLVALAVVIGAATPQVAPFSRSRLTGLAGGTTAGDRLGRGMSLVMSYESIADESSFVLGPVLVGLLTAFVHPAAPLLCSIALTVTATVAFALHRTAAVAGGAGGREAAEGARDRAVRVLTRPGILGLMAGMLLVGGVFGATLTAVTGFMRDRGAVGQAGLVYGAMSVGAIAFVVGMSAIPAGFGLAVRWPVFAGLGVTGCVVLACAPTVPWLIVGLVLAGCGIGATLVTLFSLGAVSAPPGRTTTVLTALQSTLVVGQALVTAAAGALVDGVGAVSGFLLASALAAMLCVLGAFRLRRTGPTA